MYIVFYANLYDASIPLILKTVTRYVKTIVTMNIYILEYRKMHTL